MQKWTVICRGYLVDWSEPKDGVSTVGEVVDVPFSWHRGWNHPRRLRVDVLAIRHRDFRLAEEFFTCAMNQDGIEIRAIHTPAYGLRGRLVVS